MIGIDISDRSIKLVQLSNNGQYDLLAHCWQSVPDGIFARGVILRPEALKKLLISLFKQCHLSLDNNDVVVSSIPETQSFLRVIEVPIMDESEIEEAVQWEVSQHIPFGLENVYIDWQPVTSGHKAQSGRQEVLVGAAQKKVVDPLLKVLQDLGFDLAALELESQALVRALISEELRSKRGLLIIDLGGTGTNVIIHDHGAMRFTASLQYGADKLMMELSQEDQNSLAVPRVEKLDNISSERIAKRMHSAQEELVTEIRGVVDFYNNIETNHEVKEILLTGGGSNLPGLEKVFLQYFDNVHVQRGNPWVNMLATNKQKKTPLRVNESVHFATAIGLALRQTNL